MGKKKQIKVLRHRSMLRKKSKKLIKALLKSVKKSAVYTHFHLATRPHRRATKRLPWYNQWHEWRFHNHIHSAVLAVYVIIVSVVLMSALGSVHATISQNWNFSIDTDYSYDNTKIELDGTSARLKAQNYNDDSNTKGLWHFDETSGLLALDSSANGNNANLQSGASFAGGVLNNILSLDNPGEYASVNDSPSLTLGGNQTIEAWTKFDSGFSTSSTSDAGVVDKGSYRLYYDRTSGKINYELGTTNSDTWTKRGGNEINGSWDDNGKTIVRTTAVNGSSRYIGLGAGVGDAEVWRWDGSNWSQVGGDGKNNSWADATFEDVWQLQIMDGRLYTALGSSAGDAEVWSCDLSSNCNSWTKEGGDGVKNSWPINVYEKVGTLTAVGSTLYAGLGSSANDAEVWSFDGSTWTKIGGDSLNSSWGINYEEVVSLTGDGSNLYAGLGNTATEGEVWRWDGSSWTKIGGDGVNGSWATADNIEQVYSLNYFGGNLYAGLSLSAGDADVWRWDGSSWTKIGGDGLNGSWAAGTYEVVGAFTNDGSNLYSGIGNSNGDGEIYRWNGSSWTKIGGDGLNGSWSTNFGDGVYALSYSGGTLYAGLYDSGGDGQYWAWDGSSWERLGGGYVNGSWGYWGLQSVESSTTMNDKMYFGTGLSVAGNAQVWEYDGVNDWRLIGGQGINGSWAENMYENVYTLQQFEGNLYAGLGTTANDAEVWRWDGSSWTKVGGDGINGGWTTNYENILSMVAYRGKLCAGLGASTNDAEIWCWDGSTWAKIGGDGLNSSWNTTYEEVFIMRVYREKLIAGIGAGTGDATIWEYDGNNWSMIGGNDVNGSWPASTYERVRSAAVYNGQLYIGLGDSTGDGEIWRWGGTSWEKVAGNNLNSSWPLGPEYVSTLLDFKGKLYAGTGYSANIDAAVWSFGNNAFLSSNATSQDNGWHHIAATFNGSEMKIFIDGVQNASGSASAVIPDNDLPLYIGSTYGSSGRGEGQGYLHGSIDEVRLSDTVRNNFTSKPFPVGKQIISSANAKFTYGAEKLTAFSTSETLNGGSISYQLSNDDGTNWKYWDGANWSVASGDSQANSATDINSHIENLPLDFSGVKWRAILTSNGNQRTQLNSVTIDAQEDATPPDTNASNINAKKSVGGDNLGNGAWTNGASPYFSWTAGSDSGAGIYGYCLYLGTDNSANLITTKGLLGTTKKATGSHCQYITSDTHIDLSEPASFSSPLTTSNDLYYLKVQAIDKAGNLAPTTVDFNFRFDNTPPRNPGYISTPSGFINTKDATLTWPTSGPQSADDDNAGLAGLQYRVGPSGTWYGDTHDGSGSISDLLTNDGSYQTSPGTDYANLAEGINTIYFRTWDQAGNVTTSYVSAALKINTSGSPSEPQSLSVTPSSSSTNAFSFSWDKPTTFVGDESALNYCYTINTVPSVATCNYTGAGIKNLPSGPYATSPGANTFYVVAKDESGNINYASYSSIVFSANTTAPGIPGNLDIVDVSIKASSKWRLAITWDVPTTNAGDISSYKVYRSTDNATFTQVGSSSSTTYIDASLAQVNYYYKVTACDSTNNCSAPSTVVSMLPTGKFTEPATLVSGPTSSGITTKRANVSWTTDRASDSKIAIGTTSGRYSASEIGSSAQETAHSINLDNLAAGTTYYYKVKWTDADGNTGISQEFTFTTSPAPVIKEVTTSGITLAGANVTFTSVNAQKVKIYYGGSDAFGGLKTINTSPQESSYSVSLDGLADGSKYYYQLSAIDSEGAEYKGNVFSFNTPQRPRIMNLAFEPVTGEPTSTQSVSWTTNVPADSTVTYGKVGREGKDIHDSKMTTDHKIIVSGLDDDSQYSLVAQSRDAGGNLAVSDRQQFKTALDTRPPKVSGITVESSIRGSGAEARGQVIVSWKTDEPSTTQVAYGEGSSVAIFNNRTSEETSLTTEHVAVISNLPTSRVYSIQPVSYDKSRNTGSGESQTAIIGRANESVLTIIFNSLQKVFGL